MSLSSRSLVGYVEGQLRIVRSLRWSSTAGAESSQRKGTSSVELFVGRFALAELKLKKVTAGHLIFSSSMVFKRMDQGRERAPKAMVIAQPMMPIP